MEKTTKKYPALIGIDAGLNGGLAIAADGQITGMHVMPLQKHGRVDAKRVQELSTSNNAQTAYIELQQARSLQKGTMTTIRNFERLVTALELVGVIVVEVRPQTWQKAMLPAKYKTLYVDTKEASIEKCLSMGVNLPKRGPRATKYGGFHDGIADAVLIALYGWMTERNLRS